MKAGQSELYIGIDLNDNWTQISFFWPGMDEPKTISIITGEEKYRIMTALCKEADNGQWKLKEAGKALALGEDGVCEDKLFSRSLEEAETNPEDYTVRKMFLLFLRKVIRLLPIPVEFSQITGITFNLEEIDYQKVKLLRQLMEEIGISKYRVFIQDKKESFCHFVMNQKPKLSHYDVVLFECEMNQIICHILRKNKKTIPNRIEMEECNLGTLPELEEQRDKVFGKLAEGVFEGRIVSAVYLVGDGFEGKWLKDALHILCRGRSAFQGKNLYTKGACCGAYMATHKEQWDYVYLSEYKLKDNIYIQVNHGDQKRFVGLVNAGNSKYEAYGSCQVLLEGDPFVDIWLQEPDSEHARIESLELSGLMRQRERTTRLKIEVLPAEDEQLLVRICDLGFGQWYISSKKVWEYYING